MNADGRFSFQYHLTSEWRSCM